MSPLPSLFTGHGTPFQALDGAAASQFRAIHAARGAPGQSAQSRVQAARFTWS